MCSSSRRETDMLCVVEMPADLLMMEQAQCYRGMYFVLMGRLSPLDGVGARELPFERLLQRARELSCEVILATNFTVEGEATAHYIATLLRHTGYQGVTYCTRLCRLAANWNMWIAGRWRKPCWKEER